MRTIRTIAELRDALAEPRRAGSRIGLVPTMGAFHDGHLSLMRHARADCDVVVVSLFVNPTQFNERADLDRYPRDEQRDATLAADVGVDYLFAPSAAEVYPDGFATKVSVDAGLTNVLEGELRGRGHFDAVTTVVSKLFNMVGPDFAYFGQKDAQQALVIRRMVADLNLPVQIIAVCYNKKGIVACELAKHFAGKENHAITLAADLRVPEHTKPLAFQLLGLAQFH